DPKRTRDYPFASCKGRVSMRAIRDCLNKALCLCVGHWHDHKPWLNLAYQKAFGLAVGQKPSSGSALGNFGHWKCLVAG
ncbi:MAG: hypothetical protein VST67_11690, partial [Nitrospirota bacterium]|nr:hypothetical protein [Nitrospirota bacterium]